MPQQFNRISYPVTASTREGRSLVHHRKTGWLTAIKAKNGRRRMFIKIKHPELGDIIVWLHLGIVQEMIKYFTKTKYIHSLRPNERQLLYGTLDKDSLNGDTASDKE